MKLKKEYRRTQSNFINLTTFEKKENEENSKRLFVLLIGTTQFVIAIYFLENAFTTTGGAIHYATLGLIIAAFISGLLYIRILFENTAKDEVNSCAAENKMENPAVRKIGYKNDEN